MRTKPRLARRRDFLLRGGTFSRLSARRTPPGGRPREWVTATCVLRSSPLPSSKKGSANPPRINPRRIWPQSMWIVSIFQLKKTTKFSFLSFFSARRLRYRMKMGSFPAPTSPRALTCKPSYSLLLDVVYCNLAQHSHKCSTGLKLHTQHALSRFHPAISSC